MLVLMLLPFRIGDYNRSWGSVNVMHAALCHSKALDRSNRATFVEPVLCQDGVYTQQQRYKCIMFTTLSPLNANWAVESHFRNYPKLASAALRRLVVRAAAPVYLRVAQASIPRVRQTHWAVSDQSYATGRMKQRGIASFFGGSKAENSSRASAAKAGKSAIAKSQDPSEVLKDANSSANKRPREVITQMVLVIQHLSCEQWHTRLTLKLSQEAETAAATVLPEPPKGKLKRLRKADSTETPVQVACPTVSLCLYACCCPPKCVQTVTMPNAGC